MECGEFDRLVEAIADGTSEPDAAARAHLAGCAACTARLGHAREIERFLANRETPAPPAAFTAMVMGGVVRQRWQTERIVDIGFNLAVAAGILVILGSAAGVAFSLGLLTIRIDFDAIAAMLAPEVARLVLSQAQTVGLAAAMLTVALVLWWWAETESA
jgi:hypothetical protein